MLSRLSRSAVTATSLVQRAALVTTRPALAGDMFCMQCEQTEKGTGCTVVGVCGKTPTTAALQDMLVYNLKGLSTWASLAREAGIPEDVEVNRFTLAAMFSTLTNVNFDPERFSKELIPQAIALRDRVAAKTAAKYKEMGKALPDLTNTAATYKLPAKYDTASLAEEAKKFGVLERRAEQGEEISRMQELITYGLKGTCAYGHHAEVLGKEDDKFYANIQAALALLDSKDVAKSQDFGNLLTSALKVGETNLQALAMLDAGHNEKFGAPVPTQVSFKPVPGKCILVSGHDMFDLENLLKQTEGTGINVYTHGEMLPAHGYPGLKKYKHLAGNYGGAWQLQKFEFSKFPGPIVMTTNCIVEPRRSYKERIFTCGVVGWPDVKQLHADGKGVRNFSEVIAAAKSMEGFTADAVATSTEPTITVGFGHKTVLSVADKVLDAVKAGHLKHIFLIGGCDGAETERNYFRDVAMKSPSSSLILTLGCGKYRFNKHDFGLIPNTGLPRVLDMGQCNDAYGAVVVATTLAKALGTDVNGLPLSFAISWFEQKAVAVLLTLLHLGVKNIHLGPNLPAFVGPQLAGILTSQLGLSPTNVANVDSDMKKFLA